MEEILLLVVEEIQLSLEEKLKVLMFVMKIGNVVIGANVLMENKQEHAQTVQNVEQL